jgi:nicotinate-nucleotide--dimethylbenzimidazole phosphoribosyltransferase
MTSDRSVLDEVVSSVQPVDLDELLGARARLASRGSLGRLEDFAARLSAMRRVACPPLHKRALVVCAADREDGPTPSPASLLLRGLADGRAPLSALARAAKARVVLVDSGVRGLAEENWPGVLKLRDDDCSSGHLEGSVHKAIAAVQTGIALTLSLASEGLDLVGLGELPHDRPSGEATLAAVAEGADPLVALAEHGGFALGTLAGLCLCSAAIRVPVILDGVTSVAAAVLAARLSPAAKDYFIAAHPQPHTAHARALATLDLVPLCDVGLSGGDGCGAAIALGLADHALSLLGGESA